MLEWRLKATAMADNEGPDWANVHFPPSIIRASFTTRRRSPSGRAQELDEVDPELLKTYEKLAFLFTNASCSPASPWMRCSTAYRWQPPLRRSWASWGSSFVPFGGRPGASELVQKYLGTVVPYSDNFFASLNSRVHRRSFCYIPRASGADGAFHVFPYQRQKHGQFERTLIIADAGSYVSYLEGCTPPCGTPTN